MPRKMRDPRFCLLRSPERLRLPRRQYQLAARDVSSVAPAARPGEGGSAALRPPLSAFCNPLPALCPLMRYDQSPALSLQRLRALSLAVEEYSLNNQATIHLSEWGNTSVAEVQAQVLNSVLPSSAILQINKFDWKAETFDRLKSAFPKRKIILPL